MKQRKQCTSPPKLLMTTFNSQTTFSSRPKLLFWNSRVRAQQVAAQNDMVAPCSLLSLFWPLRHVHAAGVFKQLAKMKLLVSNGTVTIPEGAFGYNRLLMLS